MKSIVLMSFVILTAGVAEPQDAPAEATREKEGVQKLTERAKTAESKGDRAEALKAYEALRNAAPEEEAGTSPARAAATLQAGRNLEALAVGDAAAAHLAQARARYEEVIRVGDPAQKLAARNALGVLLLRQGDKATALAMLKQIDLATIPARKAFVFRSNLGRAYEENGHHDAALAAYQAALEAEPAFAPAMDGAFRVLLARTPPAVGSAVTLLDLLEKKGQARAAAQRARQLVVAWPAAAASEILPPLAHLYAAARVTPAEFDAREWPELATVTDAALRPALGQLRSAFQPDMPLSTHVFGPPDGLSAWVSPEPRARAMAALLRFLGDLHDNAERAPQALSRYWAAWLLTRDLEHALAVVSVLEAHPELQNGQTRALDHLVDGLFEAKGQAYAREDWPSILRLHVVLAGIFEKRGAWSNSGPRSAMFQWEHAARAAERVRVMNPDLGRAPGIHLSLARCYRRAGPPASAWREYVEAAERFLADGRPDQAREAVEEGSSLGLSLTPADKDRLEKVKRALGMS